MKMVHNGIEYGDMQLIAEAYDVLRVVGGLTVPEMAQVFTDWNKVRGWGEGWGGGWGRGEGATGSVHRMPKLRALCLDAASLLTPLLLLPPAPIAAAAAAERAGVLPGGDHGQHLQEEG